MMARFRRNPMYYQVSVNLRDQGDDHELTVLLVLLGRITVHSSRPRSTAEEFTAIRQKPRISYLHIHGLRDNAFPSKREFMGYESIPHFTSLNSN
jgi:hypothetical protein